MNAGIELNKTFERQTFLEEKTKKRSKRILLPLTYNRTLSSIRKLITNNSNLLHINHLNFKKKQKPLGPIKKQGCYSQKTKKTFQGDNIFSTKCF